MKKTIRPVLAFILLLLSWQGIANEGMWLPQLLQKMNESEMKSLGLKLSANDIYNINNGSLKDAIVLFGGGCTGEIISNEGLLLTNHHCGYSQIQNHSSLEHNYLENGFWATDKSKELSNPGLSVTFIVRIDDVTAQVLKNIPANMPEEERKQKIEGNMRTAAANAKKEQWQNAFVRGFFEGNQYYLFVTEIFKDVRLVGAPPSSIGKFGSDTDNWMWPRHTGDFSIFRVYADKNNRPAAYSADNVPYKPKKSLTISLDGVAKDDFTMVFGFPGTTKEYLYSAAVAQTLNVLNPVKIEIRDRTLKVWDGYMRSDKQIKIQYASKYASMSNSWKKWIGENMGLKRSNAVDKKIRYENDFTKRINANSNLKAQYGQLLDQLSVAYSGIESYALARDIFNETTRAIELFNFTSKLFTFIDNYYKAPADYNNLKESLLKDAAAFYKNYNAQVDKDVCKTLLPYFMEKMPSGILSADIIQAVKDDYDKNIERLLFNGSNFADSSKFRRLMAQPEETAVKAIMIDPSYVLLADFYNSFEKNANENLRKKQDEIDLLQRTYMKAQMDAFTEKKFYPDANLTLRLTYGKVDGFIPRDGMKYDYYTYLDGVMEKYVPGDYEFDVPSKLIELYKNKDYGQYGVNGKMPVCFIASNHTTGGNSGSPALDAYGNLIGLNFDRAWEGTMSDINYDPSICRNIMVDIRYVLFIVDKYAGASHLIKEMNLVHPKNK